MMMIMINIRECDTNLQENVCKQNKTKVQKKEEKSQAMTAEERTRKIQLLKRQLEIMAKQS